MIPLGCGTSDPSDPSVPSDPSYPSDPSVPSYLSVPSVPSDPDSFLITACHSSLHQC